MTAHACRLESRCARGSWPDRHPAAAVTLAIVVLAMAVAHPWLLAVVGAGGAVYAAVRRQQRRGALAARADWEHRKLMAQVRKWPPPLQLPRPRHRPADHWSPTELMRAGRR